MWSEWRSLTEESIRGLPPGPGVYVLGRFGVFGQFDQKYVGRADEILPRRLKDHLPNNESNLILRVIRCTHFSFASAANAVEAFRLECGAYHALRDEGYRLVNQVHPARPASGEECPVYPCDRVRTLAEAMTQTPSSLLSAGRVSPLAKIKAAAWLSRSPLFPTALQRPSALPAGALTAPQLSFRPLADIAGQLVPPAPTSFLELRSWLSRALVPPRTTGLEPPESIRW